MLNNLNPSLFIAILAILLAYTGIAFQLKTVMLNQLTEIAKICNSLMRIDNKLVLHNIIVAKQIFELHQKRSKLFLFFVNKQSIIDNFYLLLHPNIRIYISQSKYPNDEETQKIFETQLNDARNFLKESIYKYK